ncbi:hypothetical protein MA16_Dca000451 [Dendrobium catenatum]|uniref:Uncharacterized protein n=1 Tax=Dendrobium catenatum TaxID=906689 RepID=A0A2I0WTX6_9ASPA|nr:hypothetical protein MA16_Dca000451 [Dendrobium catenatum]
MEARKRSQDEGVESYNQPSNAPKRNIAHNTQENLPKPQIEHNQCYPGQSKFYQGNDWSHPVQPKCKQHTDVNQWRSHLSIFKGLPKTEPFKVLYGRDPPHLVHYSHKSTPVSAVDQHLKERDQVLEELKRHLLRAQQIMKRGKQMRPKIRERNSDGYNWRFNLNIQSRRPFYQFHITITHKNKTYK